jgi:hypothetical protein
MEPARSFLFPFSSFLFFCSYFLLPHHIHPEFHIRLQIRMKLRPPFAHHECDFQVFLFVAVVMHPENGFLRAFLDEFKGHRRHIFRTIGRPHEHDLLVFLVFDRVHVHRLVAELFPPPPHRREVRPPLADLLVAEIFPDVCRFGHRFPNFLERLLNNVRRSVPKLTFGYRKFLVVWHGETMSMCLLIGSMLAERGRPRPAGICI